MNSHLIILAILLSSTLVFADENLELQKSITAAIISATEDSDDNVRFAAFYALKDQPRSDAIASAFRRGLEDDNTRIRLVALEKYVEFEGPTDEVLERLLLAIDEQELAPTARNLLIEIGEPAGPRLIKALDSDHAERKLFALYILGHIDLGKHRKETVANVTATLKDEDFEIRIAAINALKRIMVTQLRSVADRGIDAKYVRYATALIAKYDTNKDGVLTEDEWGKLLQTSRLPDLAKDQDGRITPVELARILIDSR